MNDQNIKITGFLSILMIFCSISCEKTEYDTDLNFEKDGEFLYKTETAYCRRNPEGEIWSKTYRYDRNGNLTEKITYRNHAPDMKTKSTYNSNNQLVTDSIFYYTENQWKPDHYFTFRYSGNLLQEKRRIDSDENITHKTVYKYIGTNPLWEEFYFFTEGKWKYQYAHKFTYNRKGQPLKKESYQKESKDKVYDQFIYTYKHNRLYTEKRIIRTGEVSFIKKYFYTKEGFPDKTIKDGNTIEKYFYDDGKLVEKHTWYFGIDPGFSACGGNLIYKYKY